ncbi:MAG: heparinase II/III family protein [Bacteroidales bacterium]|nr:heparinase II/III family protein [Bacteroidales bacterium]
MFRFRYLSAIAALLLTCWVQAGAQSKNVPKMGKYGYPIYNDYSIPKPDKPLKITRDDLKLTDRYLSCYPEGVVEADAAAMRVLYEYYKNDPEGQAEWRGLQDKALKCIPTWDMGKLIQKRYVYSLANLKPLGWLYIFTGNELVSDFIRGHLAKAASLPVDFWIHAELRHMDPKKPQGCIETSYLNQAFGVAIQAVRRNMSEEELKTIETAWHEKGMGTGINWLEAHQKKIVGNFTAVIGNGVLYAAKYFKDDYAWNLALKHIKMYVDSAILPDGSNFEGYGYYAYPAAQLLIACSILSPEQIHKLMGESALKNVMKWRVSGMLFGEGVAGYPSPMRIVYGDNPCAGSMVGRSDAPTWLSILVMKDGLAEWIRQTYSQKGSSRVMLLKAKYPGLDVQPVSPEEAGIPLLTTYQSGDCFMRSGWGDDDVVVGLKAINGNPVEKVYPHARPEINSLNLGAYGEYLICNAASASYRSPIRKEHDIRTWRANVVTVDGKDQLFPYNWLKKSGCFGYPSAEIVRKEILPDGGMVLSNEAKAAYATPMKQATRTVRYIPEGRFYIVRDMLVPEDGEQHHFDHRFFIFNYDFKTKIEKNKAMLTIERPRATLYIAVNSPQNTSFEYKDAYIHGLAGRDYDPGGKQEGKLGNAVGLVWSSDAPSFEATSVLYPTHPGEAAPKIKFGKGFVSVNGKKYPLD